MMRSKRPRGKKETSSDNSIGPIRCLIDKWCGRPTDHSVEELWHYAEQLVRVYSKGNGKVSNVDIKLLASAFRPSPGQVLQAPEELSAAELRQRYWNTNVRRCGKWNECGEKQRQVSSCFKYVALKRTFAHQPLRWAPTCDDQDVEAIDEQLAGNADFTLLIVAECLVDMALEANPSAEFSHFLFKEALSSRQTDNRRPVRELIDQLLLNKTGDSNLNIEGDNVVLGAFKLATGEEAKGIKNLLKAFKLAVDEKHRGIQSFCCQYLRKMLLNLSRDERHSKMEEYLSEYRSKPSVVYRKRHTFGKKRNVRSRFSYLTRRPLQSDADSELKALEMLLDVAMDERMGLEPVLLKSLEDEGLLWLADSDKYLHIVQKLLSWEASNAPLRFFPAMQRSCASWLKRAVTRRSENLVELLTEFVTSHSLDTESILRTETSSLVHLAAAVATERIVDLILAFASGCDVAVVFAPDELGRTPLHYAASNMDDNVMDKLLHWILEREDDFARWTSADEAARERMKAAAESAEGVDDVGDFRFDLALMLIPDKEGQTPVHVAVSEGNASVLEYLIEKCCQFRAESVLFQPDNSGKFPLEKAEDWPNYRGWRVHSAVAKYLVDTASKSELLEGFREFLFDRVLLDGNFREVRHQMGKLFSEKNIERIVGSGLDSQSLDWQPLVGQNGAFQRALEEDNGGILKFLCLCLRSASTSMPFVLPSGNRSGAETREKKQVD